MYYFVQVCQACIKNDGHLLKIHDLDIDNITFYTKLNLCFPNLIFEETSMKMYLCQNCSNILRKMYDFRELCTNSERILKAYVLQLEQANSIKTSEQNNLNELIDNNYKELSSIIKEIPKSSELILENFDSEINKVIKTEAVDFEYVDIQKFETNNLLDIKDEPVDTESQCQDYIVSAKYTDEHANYANVNKDSSMPGIQSPNTLQKFRSKRLIGCKRMDNREKRYKCDVCSRGFNNSDHLRTHIRIHTGEKPYECDVCYKSFNRLDILQIHKRIHTGEKPYECDICSKCFNNSSHLTRHSRIHTGEKPYECEICNKRFNNTSDLQKHKRIHTGEHPYKCNICNKTFTHSSSLRTHKRIHSDNM